MASSRFPIAARTLFQRSPRVLEVERKFAPTSFSIAALRANTGPNPFPSHRFRGTTKISDIYYDKHNVLFTTGIYVRERNGTWEAKVRRGGDYVNSAFEEITDVPEIMELVESAFKMYGKSSGLKDLRGLKVVAKLETTRQQWTVGEFGVVVDETSFGHRVGEVELLRAFFGEGEDAEKAQIVEMDQQIRKFMEEYEWAFPCAGGDGGEKGKVEGKLSAYFAWKRSQSS